MNEPLRLKQKVIEFLKSAPEQKFNARDIAIWIAETFPDQAAAKMEKSGFENQARLLTQLVAEIGANRPIWEKQIPELRTTDGVRPRLFYWTERSEEQEVREVEEGEHYIVEAPTVFKTDIRETGAVRTETKRSEHDLYPRLIEYLKTEHSVFGFRIDEKKSSNRYGPGGNRWLFPDVVGMEDLTKGMDDEVVRAVKESGDRRIRLWSFEVKLLINRSNARETYFQALSNSSWANYGYLVAESLEGGETLKELRILFSVHGIGVIRLDANNPSESQILIPARERPDLEWPMCNRLAEENKDFKDYIKRVRQFFQTGDM